MAYSKDDKRQMCLGCRNNRYNMGVGYCERPGIDAPVTVTECWNLKTARVVVRRRVSVSQVPPWTQKPVATLSCMSEPGYVYIDPKTTH